MAFTFQINDDVEFNHDKQLLKKADDNIPELAKRVVTPVQVVETVSYTHLTLPTIRLV